jgi:hypothetical protein
MEVDVCVTLFVLDVQCALFAADTRWKNVWKNVNIFILVRLNVSESMLIAKSAHLFLPITKRTMLLGCLSHIVKPMCACFVLHRLNTMH